MFLATVYTVFAVVLFLYFEGGDDEAELEMAKPSSAHTNLPSLSTVDPRRENFITMADVT